jgi:hypothetical protein
MGPLLDNANSEDCLLRRTMVLLDLAVYYRGLQRACCLHQGCHILYYTARISISLKDYLRCKLKVSVLLFFLSFLQLKKKPMELWRTWFLYTYSIIYTFMSFNFRKYKKTRSLGNNRTYGIIIRRSLFSLRKSHEPHIQPYTVIRYR